MVSHKKTTVNLPDSLVRGAQRAAHEDGTTLKALLGAGLRGVLAQRTRGGTFRLRDASVDGNGPRPAFRGVRWEQLRDAVYERPA